MIYTSIVVVSALLVKTEFHEIRVPPQIHYPCLRFRGFMFLSGFWGLANFQKNAMIKHNSFLSRNFPQNQISCYRQEYGNSFLSEPENPLKGFGIYFLTKVYYAYKTCCIPGLAQEPQKCQTQFNGA